MDPATQGFIFGIVGILGGLFASCMGWYFAQKARTAPMQELLYRRQLDLVVKTQAAVGRALLAAGVLRFEYPQAGHEEALKRLKTAVGEITEFRYTSSSLLPSKLARELSQLDIDIHTVYVTVLKTRIVPKEDFNHLMVRAEKVAAISRAYLAVDELSMETATLMVAPKDLEIRLELDVADIQSTLPKSSSSDDPDT